MVTRLFFSGKTLQNGCNILCLYVTYGGLAKDALILLDQLEFYSNVPIESNQKLNLFLSFCCESENEIKHLDYQVSFGGICDQLKAGMLNLR